MWLLFSGFKAATLRKAFSRQITCSSFSLSFASYLSIFYLRRHGYPLHWVVFLKIWYVVAYTLRNWAVLCRVRAESHYSPRSANWWVGMMCPYVHIIGFTLLPYGSKTGEELTLRQATKSYCLHRNKLKGFLRKLPYSCGRPIFSLLIVPLHPKSRMNTSGACLWLSRAGHVLAGTGLC